MSTGRPADAPMTLVDSGVPGPASTAAERAVADRSEGGSKAHRDWMLTAVLLLADAVMIAFAFYTSWTIRYIAEIGPEIEETNYVPFAVFAPLLLGLIPVTWLTFATSGLYRQRRGTEWFDDIAAVFKSTSLSTMAVFAGVSLLRYPATSRLTFILTWLIGFRFVVSGRALVQMVATLLHRRGIGVERVLVVGGNNLGRIIMQSLAARAHLGYQVVGFVDDDRAGDFGRYRHLGGLDDVERLAVSERVDHVIVALPSASDVAIVGWNAVTKRAIDVLTSAVALMLLSPLLAVVALLIRLESPGPIIYRHTRIGKNRQPFTMLKFRSMRQDADRQRTELVERREGDNRLFKDRSDPRRTKIGAIIRRWSLDELPQFWNVFVGDMSVVGPRPQIPPEVANYEDWHYKRLAVSPGLTGLWQVSGRSELSFDEMVIYDIYYIENWSLGLDFRILLRTLPAVLQGRGAF